MSKLFRFPEGTMTEKEWVNKRANQMSKLFRFPEGTMTEKEWVIDPSLTLTQFLFSPGDADKAEAAGDLTRWLARGGLRPRGLTRRIEARMRAYRQYR